MINTLTKLGILGMYIGTFVLIWHYSSWNDAWMLAVVALLADINLTLQGHR